MQVLHTARLDMREPRHTDAEALKPLLSQPEVGQRSRNVPYPLPPDGAEQWIERVVTRLRNGTAFPFLMWHREDSTLVGVVVAYLNPDIHAAELALAVNRAYWNQGYATEAGQRLVEFCFEDLQLNRVYAAFFNNPAAQHVLENAGMVYEGTLRQHVLQDDTYYDLVYYGLLRSEFEARREG